MGYEETLQRLIRRYEGELSETPHRIYTSQDGCHIIDRYPGGTEVWQTLGDGAPVGATLFLHDGGYQHINGDGVVTTLLLPDPPVTEKGKVAFISRRPEAHQPKPLIAGAVVFQVDRETTREEVNVTQWSRIKELRI